MRNGILNGLKDKAETEIWNNFINTLYDKLPAPVKPWIDYLEPAMPINEISPNGIFLIKCSAGMGIRFLENHLTEIENVLEEITGLKRTVRIKFDETVKPKKRQKQTAEQKAHEQTALKMENLALMHSFTGLNLKYTFENFVEGENSKFAYRIAKLIAQAPGEKKYNPLFLSGSVGVGKTHLMHAIGHEILKNFKDLKIRYTNAEEFTNKLVESINSKERNEKMRKFRELYRSVDVLLIDDIQFIEGKGRTEEEIFNTFNALYNAGKQLVFASDRPLSALEAISDRLKTRFEWGIRANIKVPDLETRIAIVKNLAKTSNFKLSDDVAFLLADEFSSNVRELEGAFNKASAMASIEEVDLTVENTKEFLELNEKKKKITVDSILASVEKYFGVERNDILSTSRSKEIVNARKYAMYLSREMLDLSLPKLAKEFKRNHTTVMYQCENLKKEMQGNKAMQIIKDELLQLIKK